MSKVSSYHYQNRGERIVHEKLLSSVIFKNAKSWTNLFAVDYPNSRLCELDIVFLNSDGLWCFEVKSGPVRRDDRGWHYQTYSSERSPFEQVYENSFRLASSIKTIFRKKRSNLPGINVYYSVCFSDIDFKELSVSWDQATILDSSGLVGNIDSFLKKLKKFHLTTARKQFPNLNKSTIDLIALTISDSFDIPESLKSISRNVNNSIFQFTDQQSKILNSIPKDKFVLVDGVPGSGKSIIARKIIKEILITQRKKILFVCSNSEFLNLFYLNDKYAKAKFDFFSLAGFVQHLTNQLTTNETYKWKELISNSEIFEYLIRTYEVIVFDEAQDYFDKYFSDFLLRFSGVPSKKVFVFFDSKIQKYIYNQGFGSRLWKSLIDGPFKLYELGQNLRNANSIAETAVKLTSFATNSLVTEPGVCKEIVTESDSEDLMEIEALLKKLDIEGIQRNQIVFLSQTTLANSIYSRQKEKFHELGVVDYLEGDRKDKYILYPSILYKGLESDVIFLLDFKSPTGKTTASLLHLSITRAKSICYIFRRQKK